MSREGGRGGSGSSPGIIAYVGCYTEPDRRGHGDGIVACRVDPSSGNWSEIQSVKGEQNPSFLAIEPRQRFRYAVHGRNVRQVSACAMDPSRGELALLNRQAPTRNNPIYPAIATATRCPPL